MSSAKLYCCLTIFWVTGLVFGILIGRRANTTPEPFHSAYSIALNISKTKAINSKKFTFGLHLRHVHVGNREFAMALPWPQSNAPAANVHGSIFKTGVWFPRETKRVAQIFAHYCARSGPHLVLDVGSNVGWYSLVAAAFGCRVMAFDGNLEVLSYLRMSVALNQYDKLVQIVDAVVSNDTDVEFNGWHTHLKSFIASVIVPDPHLTSRAVKLDDVVKEPVLYAKVDVESWEPSAFASAARLLQYMPPLYIYFEMTYYHRENWRYDYLGVTNQLRQAGYNCRSEVLGRIEVMPSTNAEFDQLLSMYATLCKPPQRKYCQDEYFCVHSSAAYVPGQTQREP